MKRQSIFLLCVFVLVNFLILWGQSLAAFWKWRSMGGCLMPEARYYIQGLVLLVPLVPAFALRLRHGRKILALLVAALVVHAGAFLVKAHVPDTRRNQYVAACDWATGAIRADYKGPARDAEPFFTPDEYHPLARPAVEAHIQRVSYLLGGRRAALIGCGLVDIPDYIVDEPHRVNRLPWYFAEYETLAERKFGKRDFIIYKRIK